MKARAAPADLSAHKAMEGAADGRPEGNER